jgi:hypothetical protein
MNENRDKILAIYTAAGMNQRLHMYLQLRDLRSEFMLIHQNELNTSGSNVVNVPDQYSEGYGNFIGRTVSCIMKKAFAWS